MHLGVLKGSHLFVLISVKDKTVEESRRQTVENTRGRGEDRVGRREPVEDTRHTLEDRKGNTIESQWKALDTH